MRLLEKRLDEVDTKDRLTEPDALCKHSWQGGHADERRELLDTIERKYIDYGQF